MIKKKATASDEEPEQKSFQVPSEGEHFFQVTDVVEDIDSDPDIIHVKCEVIEGESAERTLLNRLSLDDDYKGFFATRLFLKAIGEPYKGNEFPIDTDAWIGRRFHAEVVHNGKYANIKEYNFDKTIQQNSPSVDNKSQEEKAWDSDE